MHYFADYEALEFNSVKASAMGIFPYYLNVNHSDTALCPLHLSCATHKGKTIFSKSAFDGNISFMELLNKVIKYNIKSKQKNLYIWFHNVKYDFRIIVHELFYNNFKHVFDSDNIEYYGDFHQYTNEEKAFSIIGRDLSRYIGANIYYNGYCIKIRDSMSILNSSQNKILKEFGFSSKIDVNWDKITIKNVQQNKDLIKERCDYDVSSLAQAITQFKQTFNTHFSGQGNTAAGMSLDALQYYIKIYEQEIYNTEYDDKKDAFYKYYPKLSDEEIRVSSATYHGGICTINKEYAAKDMYNIQMLDINSSYPHAMTQALPYGVPMPIDNFCKDGYCEYLIYISFKHKGIPFIRCHSENRVRLILGKEQLPKEQQYTRAQFPAEFDGYLAINSIDLQTLKEFAEIEYIEFCKGYRYDTNYLIADFIRPIYEERKNAKDVQKLAIKLLLNSLYGKFAQDLSGIVYQYSDLDNYTKVSAIDLSAYYKPFASAVTAYARQNWVRMCYALGKDFIYGDTDSVYFCNPVNNISHLIAAGAIDNRELGKWKTEYEKPIHKGRFLSKKNYILQPEENGKIKVTCVGLNAKYHKEINFDNFKLNSEEITIQKMVNIYGGKAMRQTKFSIKERHF